MQSFLVRLSSRKFILTLASAITFVQQRQHIIAAVTVGLYLAAETAVDAARAKGDPNPEASEAAVVLEQLRTDLAVAATEGLSDRELADFIVRTLQRDAALPSGATR